MGLSEHSELLGLLEALCEATITSEQCVQLQTLLSDDPKARRLYVEYMTFAADIRRTFSAYPKQTVPFSDPFDSLDQEKQPSKDLLGSTAQLSNECMVQDGTGAESWEVSARKEAVRMRAEEQFGRFKERERVRLEELAYRQWRAERRRLLVGVGSLAAVLVIVFCVWLSSLRPQRTPSGAPAVVAAPPAPPVVATIIRASEAQWDRIDTAPAPGTDLTAGPVQLHAGFLELAFKRGVRVILEAPAEVNLIDERLAHLNTGVLSAYVPESGRGFEVDTPSVRVTDLGTEFGLVVDQTGAANLHVLDGWVATSVVSAEHDEQHRVKAIYQGDAMRFDVQAGTIDPIDIDENRFARSWGDVLYKPRVDGLIQFELSTPPLLRRGNCRDDDYIHAFLERVDVLLGREIVVDIATPGRYQIFTGRSETMPARSKVDSYLIHWEPETKEGRRKSVSGRLTFRRPILGVITDTKRLAASDAIFGRSGTAYPADELSRRLESAPMTGYDTIVLSEDRLTLEITLSALAMDEVRVLVTAPADDER
jgi:hypothetical protein